MASETDSDSDQEYAREPILKIRLNKANRVQAVWETLGKGSPLENYYKPVDLSIAASLYRVAGAKDESKLRVITTSSSESPDADSAADGRWL